MIVLVFFTWKLKRMSTQLGEKGENKACSYLQKHGFAIVTRNYRYKRNEIDIIAKRESLLIFVEVKAKSSSRFGHPEEAVDHKKVARIIEAAENYIFQNNWQGNIRFDVIAIDLSSDNGQIVHFEDAFY